MKVDLVYRNAFKEAIIILETLRKQDYDKIPKDIIKVLKENQNLEYKYEINQEYDLKKQPMLPQTKALLFNIFRDYLATTEQRMKILEMQQEERERIENKKRKLYNPDVFSTKK